MSKPLASLVTAALVAMAIPGAEAHAPPDPRDFETRVLTDQNDDCGGHGGADNCRGSHDLLGLNIREAYEDGGHVVIFTFLLDGGGDGTLRDTLEFEGAGQQKQIELRTTDNQKFSAAGALRVDGPKPLMSGGSQDGTRFFVDVVMQRSALGLNVGDTMRSFQVTAQRDGTTGDIMPGGYMTAVGPVDGSDTSTQYTRQSLKLQGPVQYIDLNPDDSVSVQAGETKFVNLGVRSKLNDMSQQLTFTHSGGDGVSVGFHDPASAEADSYPTTYEDSIARSAQKTVHLAVTGQEATTSGTIQIVVTTDKGGRVVGEVDYQVVAADAPDDNGQDPVAEPNGSQNGDEVETPGLSAYVVLASLALLANAVRRR